MTIDLSKFHDTFFEEAAEHLNTMETGLLALDKGAEDPELLHTIFRAAHSIKGGSGSFGFTEIADFTHVLENLLDRLRDGRLSFSAELGSLLLEATDTLGHLVEATKNGDPKKVRRADVTGRLERVLDGGKAGPRGTGQPAVIAPPEPAKASGERTITVTIDPKPEALAQGQDILLLIREVRQLGEVLEIGCDASRLPPFATLEPESCFLKWIVKLKTKASDQDVHGVFLFVDDVIAVTIEAEGPPAAPPESGAEPAAKAAEPADRRATDRRATDAGSIRVSTEKVDGLINLVGELVIAQAMVNQAAGRMPPDQYPELREALAIAARNTRDLQEHVMAIRLLPVGTVFNRFPRLVRDLGDKLGKDLKLEIAGAETELDKGVLERLGDPLTHLIRNAVDHGIEKPADRQAAGKVGGGTIRLSAGHEGGGVVIEIADDGRGLPAEKIRAKAIAQGLIAADAQLSDDELNLLIFAPGFSTAEQVSDVSGRGVGMDVVKRNVEALSGTISIHSAPGKGTRIRIRLPLTLAILDGLSVSCGGQIYVIPLLAIVQSLRPAPSDIRVVFGKGEMLLLRDEILPLIRLHEVFGLADAVREPSQGIVVVIESDGRRFGLLVDDVVGQFQVVIKNLERHFRRVMGFMGATILGDGRVGFILDVDDILRRSSQSAQLESSGSLAGAGATMEAM